TVVQAEGLQHVVVACKIDFAVPVGRSGKVTVVGPGSNSVGDLLYDLVARRIELAHAVAVHQIDASLFAATDQQMRMRRTALIGQQQRPAGAQVGVVGVQRIHIEWREVIHHREAAIRRNPQDATAVIMIADGGGAIASDDKDVARRVGGRSGAVPIASSRTIGSRVKERYARQRGGVISNDPAVVWLDIPEGG